MSKDTACTPTVNVISRQPPRSLLAIVPRAEPPSNDNPRTPGYLPWGWPRGPGMKPHPGHLPWQPDGPPRGPPGPHIPPPLSPFV